MPRRPKTTTAPMDTTSGSGSGSSSPNGETAEGRRSPPGAKKTPKNGLRVSRFVWTLNNYSQREEDDIKACFATKKLVWLIFGHEVGESGTPHLQGACVIGGQRALSTIKKWPGFKRTHIEPMKGNCQQSKVYCTKEDTQNFVELGSPQEPGKRNDLLSFVAEMRSGQSLSEIVQDDEMAASYVRYSSGYHRLANLLSNRRREPPKVIWLHGTTGSGKTYAATSAAECLFGPGNYWISGPDLKWFDGYSAHKCAILDELRHSEVSFTFLLRLLDRYSLQVPFKGGFAPWVPELIFITSPHPPTIDVRVTEDLQQLQRRILLVAETPNEIARVSDVLCVPIEKLVVPVLSGDRTIHGQPIVISGSDSDSELSIDEQELF